MYLSHVTSNETTGPSDFQLPGLRNQSINYLRQNGPFININKVKRKKAKTTNTIIQDIHTCQSEMHLR